MTTPASPQASDEGVMQSVVSHVLTPGSSLNPTFLRMLDGAFVGLLLIFLILLFSTSGSIHIYALILIELALWASVKWFVSELLALKSQEQEGNASSTDAAEKTDDSKKRK